MRRSPLIAVLVVAVLTLAGSAAAHVVRHVVTTSIRATLTDIGRPKLTRLTIARGGATAYTALVRSRFCGSDCSEISVAPGRSPLREVDLGSTGEPDVILGLFTGGAHCCFVDQVFRYDAGRGTYLKTEHDFLDAGATIRKIGSRYVFMSADARIAEDALTDYAHSGAPIQIWQFVAGRFRNITRQFPNRIRADAARWMTAAKRNPNNNVGFLAAWAADEDLLGQSAHVAATLTADADAGQLRTPLGLPGNSQTGFVTVLEKLLRQLGYTR